MSTRFVLKARRAFGPELEGEALVSRDPIHFLMDIASETGVVIGVKHCLYGKNVTDKILVIPSAKGGVMSTMAIAELIKNKSGPRALLYDKTNPIMVQGAVMTNIPIMDGFGQNPVEVIRSGEGKIDLVHFGCPHLHLAEIQMLAEGFLGKKKHPEVRVWLFTALATKTMADSAGYTKILEDAGCEFFTGACGINIPAKEVRKLLENKVQVSDHVKHCYDAPTFTGDINLKTILRPTEECVQAALTGRV